MSDKVREQFEAWWPSVGQTIGKVAAWAAWRASRAAALEEAKAVVRSSCLGDIPGCNRTCCPGCHTIAAERIRALAGRGA